MNKDNIKSKSWILAMGLIAILVVAFIANSPIMRKEPVVNAQHEELNGGGIDKVIVTEHCDLFWQRGELFAYCETIHFVANEILWAEGADMPPFENSESYRVTPTPVVRPEVPPSDGWEPYTIRYSWYNPALGGPNCAVFVNGVCTSKMASGIPWEEYIDKVPGAIACPPTWPFWTRVRYEGQEWFCLDRGGKVQYVQGIPFLDFLVTQPHTAYDSIVEVEVLRP